MPHHLARLSGVVLVIAAAACRDTPATFGPTAAIARANADDVCVALQERFTGPRRDPALVTALDRITHDALAPSHLYDDTTLWTATSDSGHALLAAGTSTGDHYTFTLASDLPLPHRLGDSRHEIRLQRLGHDEYRWYAAVANAIGPITAIDVDRGVGSMLSASARAADRDLVDGSSRTFPHTATALRRLFTLDTLWRTALPDGTARIRLVVTMQQDSLKGIYPHFAGYLDHYVAGIRARATAVDSTGTPWIDLQIARSAYTLTIRTTPDGHFAPLSGPPRPMPDSLVLRGEMSTKVALFTVGLSDLVATFRPVRTPHQRTWAFQFQHEPHWHFPLAVDHLIKSPLRRPFTGDGTRFQIGVFDSLGTQTLLARETHLEMRESAIMRWIGGIAGNALSAYSGSVSAEGDAFFADMFGALRADLDP